MTTRWIHTMALAALVGGVGACSSSKDTNAETDRGKDDQLIARAELSGQDGSSKGTVTFTEGEGGIEIHADVHDLAPGSHGFHLHESGDCSAADFSSAGGHFNPTDVRHGAPTDEVHHAGDFGNIVVGADGHGTLDLHSKMLSVVPGSHSVVGKAVIIHEGADDLTSQPSGAAGARVACGVVERVTDDDTAAGGGSAY